MLEFPAPAAEHSLKSLSSLMQRLPLEAEAVKQQRRISEPMGRQPPPGPQCVANTILSAARGPQPCCTVSQATSPSCMLERVRTHMHPTSSGRVGRRQAPNPGPPLNPCGQITQPALSLGLLGAGWGKHGPHGASPRPALEGCSTSRGEAHDAHGKNTGKTDGDRLPGSAVTEQGKQGHACPHLPRLPLPSSPLRAHTSKF